MYSFIEKSYFEEETVVDLLSLFAIVVFHIVLIVYF